jgi:flavin-binding protein dodecin
MSVAKVIEITAESTESFDDAVNKGIERTADTVSGIRSAWVKDQQVTVKDGKVATYRVSMKITFVVGG